MGKKLLKSGVPRLKQPNKKWFSLFSSRTCGIDFLRHPACCGTKKTSVLSKIDSTQICYDDYDFCLNHKITIDYGQFTTNSI